MARSSSKLRLSPWTMSGRPGNVTLRPLPSLRSQMVKPTSLRPASSPAMKWIYASANLPAGFPCSLRRILTSMFMASLPRSGPTALGSGLVLFALLRVREFEISRWRSDPVPQPVLQRVQSNEHGIGRCEEVALLAVACALPVEFGGIDQNKTCG